MAQEDKHSEVNNSAIGSWSGFIYQGLVAVYYALTLLKEDKDKYIDYSLCLDAFEDFSIHDENDKIVSLHQCKCYNASHDFKDECKKMLDKKEEYVKTGRCVQNATLILHTNYNPINLSTLIQSTVFEQKKLLLKIREIVTEIANKCSANSSDIVLCRLVSLVDGFVLQIHREYHEAYAKDKFVKLWKLAQEKRLQFADIWNCLFINELFDQDTLGVFVKNQTILQLHEYLVQAQELGEDVDKKRFDIVEEVLLSLPNTEAEELFRRVHPQYHYAGDLLSVANYINNTTTHTLFDILLDTKWKPSTKFDWNRNQQYETASSINAADEKDLQRIVRGIMKNSPNNSSLRQYDWLIGKVCRQVANIRDEAKQFTSISEDENSIFAEKKIGIISIDDFNDENY